MHRRLQLWPELRTRHPDIRSICDEGDCDCAQADLVVVGSRGLGSVKRNFMGLFGLGSVSDYLVRGNTTYVIAKRKMYTKTQRLTVMMAVALSKCFCNPPHLICLKYDYEIHSSKVLCTTSGLTSGSKPL